MRTSALGFGCAGLTSLNDRGAALRLLEQAYELGITHFDVARAYGFGHAEGIVGEFLARRRDEVTVTTKFGMQPGAPAVMRSRRIVSLAKKVLAPFPGLMQRARRSTASMVTTGAFAPEQARASLETSLRELRTDHVDLLLLHECSLDDAGSDGLLAFLDGERARGTVRAIGIGTSNERLGADLSLWPAAYDVMQLANSAVEPSLDHVGGVAMRAVITHSALRDAGHIVEAARARRGDPAITAAAQRVEADLTDRASVNRLLLQWALFRNPTGVVLAGTTSGLHLLANAQAAEASLPDRIAELPLLLASLLRRPAASSGQP